MAVRDEFLKACAGIRMDVSRVSDRRVWLETDPESVRPAIEKAKAIWPDVHLSAITGLDDGESVELLYHIVAGGAMLNLRTKVPSSKPEMQTIVGILPAADSYERELHDLLGVEFPERESTPRLVLPDEWEDGVYPLRKEGKGDGQSV